MGLGKVLQVGPHEQVKMHKSKENGIKCMWNHIGT
jgi:hypothetical protein